MQAVNLGQGAGIVVEVKAVHIGNSEVLSVRDGERGESEMEGLHTFGLGGKRRSGHGYIQRASLKTLRGRVNVDA